MKKHQFFVSGTDTGVGKTTVCTALLAAARARGLRCLGLKPVAAGCSVREGVLSNDDALNLQAQSSVVLPYAQVNPIALAAPVSPHIAAAWEQKRLSADRITGLCRGAMMTPHDFFLVEGAGGWRVPIGPRETMADIAQQLQLPVILVVGLRLGCLNHALLSVEAIARDGLPLAAWVASVLDPDMLAREENLATLKERIDAPLLGVLRHAPDAEPAMFAADLDMSKLLGNAEA